ncbi:MAG: hypothetical protein SGBAC_000004 [Bacillariaceae sp.]
MKMVGRDQERSLAIISGILFAASAWWTLKKQKEGKERRKRNGQSFRNTAVASSSNISARCQQRALSPAIPYLESFLLGLQYPYDSDHPDGYIPLCVAENKLATDILSKKLMQPQTASTTFSDASVYAYNSFLGLPVARQAAAYFFAKRFLYPHLPSPSIEQALAAISPDSIGIASGAAGILNSLFFLLGDKGDAALIPRPYYSAFDSDMSLVAEITPFGFSLARPTQGPTESELDMAYLESRSQGLNPRFLLLTNPNNPLATCYRPEVIRTAINWARKRKMHTIVDEIYALTAPQEFQSVLRVLDGKLGDDVHMVWSLSKDFGASGLRVGFVLSGNKDYINGLSNLNIFGGVSNPMQVIVAELLTDDKFVDYYLEESSVRLRHNYQICVQKLEEMVLPFVPAEAGIFVYVDFSAILPSKTKEWEAKLSKLLIDHARVILTPGDSMREQMPGMFRICYAWVSPEVLKVGMERLSRIVAKVRRIDWGDLNETTLSGIL